MLNLVQKHPIVAGFVAVACLISLCNASSVVELGEKTWDQMMTGEWMVEFYAPWCPACKSLETTWTQFGGWSDNENVKAAKIDVTKAPGLSGRFLVTALPTIFHVKNGEFRQYRGSRDLNSFMSFVEDKKWQSIEPISAWKKPSGIPMSVVAMFFQLSHYLKEVNTMLLTEYGLPTWGSYAIFAIATIFIGALLGLLFVCIIDFLFPQKASQRQGFVEKQKESDEDEVRDQDLVDENEDSDREKYSGTDSDDQVEEEQQQEEEEEKQDRKKKTKKQQESPKASPKAAEVRKRKARKAE